jgi:pimeloyl-ACP methyl ester carboxylesterase
MSVEYPFQANLDEEISMATVVRSDPHKVIWTEPELEELHHKLAAFEFPSTPKISGWRYGCDLQFLATLRLYWLNEFDAVAAQAELNRFSQFTAELEPGVKLHFVHVRGENEFARPLLLLHGWPGSTFEFWPVLDRLAFPSSISTTPGEAFDLVVPSLPGYGYSFKPTGIVGARSTAAWMNQLMRTVLGYERYLVHGTDWGAGIAAWMALDFPEAVAGVHLHHLAVQPAAEPNCWEREWQANYAEAQERLGAYRHLQTTKPLSLGYLAAGNPLGQAAWLIERFHDWSDLRDRGFEDVFDKDWLLTAVMMYVMTRTFGTSAWFYAGADAEGLVMPRHARVEAPTGYAAYPDPRAPHPPRSWVEKGYNLVHWSEPERGGHFASTEVPDLMARDLREWAART